MKKLLIGCLIALIIGSLTGCTGEKVNYETNIITNENFENQETNKTKEYQSEFVTVNYNNEGIYIYEIIKCDDNEEIGKYIESGKLFSENTLITLRFTNGDEFNGFEHKYSYDGEHSYIKMVNGHEIEFYDVLERKFIKPVEAEEMFDEDYRERCFRILYTNSDKFSTVTAIKCTEEEIQYIEKTKSETYNEISLIDEVNNSFKGIIGNYGSTGEKIYIKESIWGNSFYYKVIE